MHDIAGSIQVFLIFIVPLWLILHYRHKSKNAKFLIDEDEIKRVTAVQEMTKKLEDRVQVLETILDEKIPDWKKQH